MTWTAGEECKSLEGIETGRKWNRGARKERASVVGKPEAAMAMFSGGCLRIQRQWQVEHAAFRELPSLHVGAQLQQGNGDMKLAHDLTPRPS